VTIFSSVIFDKTMVFRNKRLTCNLCNV